MPQGSVAYAVARIHAQARDALDASRIDRLLATTSYKEALRALAEIGWTGADTGVDAEVIAAEHVREAFALVRQITPCPEATESFFLRYDGLNLKALLKARCLGRPAEALSECGVYPVDLLRHAVAEHNYKKLPDILRDALDGLEKTLAVRDDALAIDTVVDKAIFALIQEKLTHVKSRMIRDYFAARADMLGAIMLLRARRMGRDGGFFREMLLPGGAIGEDAWKAAWDKPEALPVMLGRYGKDVRHAAAQAVQDADRLPALEKAMDDALLRPFSAVKREALSLEPVVGYILGAEREAAAVRLVLAAKVNGFAPEAVRERLRELYGG